MFRNRPAPHRRRDDHRLPHPLWTLCACALVAFIQTDAARAQSADRSASPIVAPDRIFTGVPFDKWLAEGDQGTFHWSAHVTAGELSNHQRLRARVELQVDGADVAARRGHGYLVMLIQFEDADRRLYRSHGVLDLDQVTEAAAKSNIVYTQDAFVRPGEYRVSMVVFDARTGEHSALERKVRAKALRNDPFPRSWDFLPAVEFTAPGDPPDSWYLPHVAGRLNLPVEPLHPLHVEVVVNASPTSAAARAGRGIARSLNNRSLADLLPALKVISQVGLKSGTMHVSLLDLTRQSVLFEQDNAGGLDWLPLRAALVKADPNQIDARALARRGRNAQFFVEQIRQRLHLGGDADAASRPAEEALRAGIVLSGPMEFDSGEDRHPIEAPDGADAKLFYIRYHSVPQERIEPLLPDPVRGGRRNTSIFTPPRALAEEPLDGLENLVKPLQPRLFDVYSPEQFRKALAALIEELSRM